MNAGTHGRNLQLCNSFQPVPGEEWDGEDRQDPRGDGEERGEAEPRALEPRREGEPRVEGAAPSALNSS